MKARTGLSNVPKKKAINLCGYWFGWHRDLAQALHDAPEIAKNIRVYYIGGPNKKWSVNAYAYIAEHFPDLWMIEANATYRGWFMDKDSPENLKSKAYYRNYIQERGAMGKDFKKYYGGDIKMGDSPSLAYLMNGNADDPSGENWGGSFKPIDRSARTIFHGNSTIKDTVAAYAVLEWRFKGPELNISEDSACFSFELDGQEHQAITWGMETMRFDIRLKSLKPPPILRLALSPN